MFHGIIFPLRVCVLLGCPDLFPANAINTIVRLEKWVLYPKLSCLILLVLHTRRSDIYPSWERLRQTKASSFPCVFFSINIFSEFSRSLSPLVCGRVSIYHMIISMNHMPGNGSSTTLTRSSLLTASLLPLMS